MTPISIYRLAAVVLFFFFFLFLAKSSFIVHAQGALKTYQGSNYTISYPETGFDDKLSYFTNRVETILSFIEPYGAITFQNVQINLTDQNQVGQNLAGLTSIEKQTVNLPASAYDQSVVVHELCHLIEFHLPLPAWMQEGQAENCARQFHQSHGFTTVVKNKDTLYTRYMVELKDVQSRVPDWILQTDLRSDEKIWVKTDLDSFYLLKELLEKVKMKDILPKLRDEFGIEKSEYHQQGFRIPNDAIICAFNASTSEDIFSIFQKYGFTIPDCSGKPKPTPQPLVTPTPTEEPSLVLFIAVPSILTLFILVVYLWYLIKSIRRIAKRKNNLENKTEQDVIE